MAAACPWSPFERRELKSCEWPLLAESSQSNLPNSDTLNVRNRETLTLFRWSTAPTLSQELGLRAAGRDITTNPA